MSSPSWLMALKSHVEEKPMVVLRLGKEDWEALQESRRGIFQFTTALPHSAFSNVKAPTLCLLLAKVDAEYHAYLGMIGSNRAITTLQSRVKVNRAMVIEPKSPKQLVALMHSATYRSLLENRLAKKAGITALSPKLSGQLIKSLASIESNTDSIRTLASLLGAPRTFDGNAALQADAIHTALKAFGLGADAQASSLELMGNCDTALGQVSIIEDGVIEHDARNVPGYRLIASDLTGRAIFTRAGGQLEVFTANRTQLERAFGVDLIYFNVTRNNLVMLQYKMLERPRGGRTEWTYRPDAQLAEELTRMRAFTQNHRPPRNEYRLNPATFFLKFVKRDGAITNGGIILPVEHYHLFVGSPASRTQRGARVVGYEALRGSYMTERPFLDLIRAGYIGAYTDTTNLLMTLVRGILSRGRAVVAAIQSAPSE